MQRVGLKASLVQPPSMHLPWSRAAALLGAALILIVACTSTEPDDVLPSLPPAPELAPDDEAVALLLEAAADDFEHDRLITPPGDNAHDRLLVVLALDPDNLQATEGLERIVERYLEFASRAAERSHFARARSMLDRARVVQRNHPEIQALEQQVTLLAEAKRVRIQLDRRAVAARDASASARLRNIGSRAKMPNTRVTIVARSDAEGRWMYQQMREAPGERRIRAELTIGSPPSVELIELQCSDGAC